MHTRVAFEVPCHVMMLIIHIRMCCWCHPEHMLITKRVYLSHTQEHTHTHTHTHTYLLAKLEPSPLLASIAHGPGWRPCPNMDDPPGCRTRFPEQLRFDLQDHKYCNVEHFCVVQARKDNKHIFSKYESKWWRLEQEMEATVSSSDEWEKWLPSSCFY